MSNGYTPDSPEEWRPVIGWPDYQVSNGGRVLSYKRGGQRILRPYLIDGYPAVTLHGPGRRQSRRVHSLVTEAFIGPRPEGLDIRHLNGNKLDPRIENLSYGTRSANVIDAVDHGTHVNARKTHCKRDHEFTADNTRLQRGKRVCRACKRLREQDASLRAAGIAA